MVPSGGLGVVPKGAEQKAQIVKSLVNGGLEGGRWLRNGVNVQMSVECGHIRGMWG